MQSNNGPTRRGRPPTRDPETIKMVCVALHRDQHARLKAAAQEQGVTMQELIRQGVDAVLWAQKPLKSRQK